MSITLTISEEKFSQDELGRNVTTLTQFVRQNITCELAEEICFMVSKLDEKDSNIVEYLDEDGGNYEIYGKGVKEIIEKIKNDGYEIQVVGSIDDTKLYEVQLTY